MYYLSFMTWLITRHWTLLSGRYLSVNISNSLTHVQSLIPGFCSLKCKYRANTTCDFLHEHYLPCPSPQHKIIRLNFPFPSSTRFLVYLESKGTLISQFSANTGRSFIYDLFLKHLSFLYGEPILGIYNHSLWLLHCYTVTVCCCCCCW